jgi:hypothetical protein
MQLKRSFSYAIYPFFGFVNAALAQNFSGLQASNFNGVHAIYQNPAGIADCRFKKHSNLVTTGLMFSNDYASLALPFTFKEWITGNVPTQYLNASGNVQWQSAWLQENLNGKPKNVYLGVENRGPAYMSRLGRNGAFAIATRTKGALQVNNVSESLVILGKNSLDSGRLQSTQISDSRFAVNINSYQELSATFAHVLFNRKTHYMKVGGTAKYLMGLGTAYAINNGLNFTMNGRDSLQLNQSDVAVGYTQNALLTRLNSGAFQLAIPTLRDIIGNGFGWDAGVVFEYRPDKADFITSQNRYLLKVGASLLDMGKLTYGKQGKTYTIKNNTPVLIKLDSGFGKAFANGIDSGIDYARKYAQQNLNYTEGTGRIETALPSSLNIQVDWNVFKWFYVNVNWSQAVVSRRDIALRRPSSVVVMPRFESKWVECSVPLSVYNDYRNVGLGIYLRLGPVFFGTDNFIKSVNSNSYSSLDFYFGISTGLPGKKSKKKGN